jgi:hypothetical protein
MTRVTLISSIFPADGICRKDAPMYDDDDEFTGGPLDHVARWTLYLIASLVVIAMATALWVSFAQGAGI